MNVMTDVLREDWLPADKPVHRCHSPSSIATYHHHQLQANPFSTIIRYNSNSNAVVEQDPDSHSLHHLHDIASSRCQPYQEPR